MKKKVLIYFLGIMVACTIIGRVAGGMSVARVSSERPKADFVEHTVKSVGKIEKNAEEGIYALPEMLVKKIHVNVGDIVEKDTILFEMDSIILEEKLVAKQNELKKIQLQKEDEEKQNQISTENRERTIRQAQDSYNQTVANADARVRKAQQEYEDAKRALDNVGDVSAEEWNTMVDGVNAKNDEWQEAERTRATEILGATQALETAKAKEAPKSTIDGLRLDEEPIEKEIAKLQELKKNKGIVVASVGGVVTDILIKTGEQTGITAALLLADTSKGYRFVADVTKEQNKYLSVGQKVSLASTSDDTVVEQLEIASIVTSEEDATVLKVIVPVAAEQFYLGENVEMSAQQGAKKYPICLPIAALGEENKEYFVYILEKEKTIMGEVIIAKRQKVTVLDRNETHVAIAPEALTTEQEVVVRANKELRDGIRVRMDES